MRQDKDSKTSNNTQQKAREAKLMEMKYEVAEELGLIDKIKSHGWTGLSAAECGRIGGKLGARMRTNAKK